MPEPKIKPRFNIVDAVILLAVLALAIGFGYRALYKPVSDAVAENVDITFTVRLRSVYTEIAEAFVKELPATCVSNDSTVPGSVVQSAEIVPSLISTTNSDGELLSVVDPVRVDILVKVTGKGQRNDVMYKVGNQEVRIGRAFIVKTNSVELTGTVIEMLLTASN